MFGRLVIGETSKLDNKKLSLIILILIELFIYLINPTTLIVIMYLYSAIIQYPDQQRLFEYDVKVKQ